MKVNGVLLFFCFLFLFSDSLSSPRLAEVRCRMLVVLDKLLCAFLVCFRLYGIYKMLSFFFF